jgi:IS5 family transposase
MHRQGQGAPRPYEFGLKVSIATTLHRSAGGQFIAHAKALPGNPYDDHTLATVIPEIETRIGASLARIVADQRLSRPQPPRPATSSRSISPARDAASPRRSNASCAGVPPSNRSSATRKRSTASGRNYLAGTHGDAANAFLAAAGYNFRRVLECNPGSSQNGRHSAGAVQIGLRAFFTGDY